MIKHLIMQGTFHGTFLDDFNMTWGPVPFLDSPGNFSGPKSHSKISNLAITQLFSSRILKMKKRSLRIRSFRHKHFSVFRYR